EDGIRDGHVTGVQTCALPISWRSRRRSKNCANRYRTSNERGDRQRAAGVDCLGAFGLWKIDLGAKDSRAARHHAFDLLYYQAAPDRKSTRLNSSHVAISYAVF